ncbi:MAG: ABC transporter ATP-binding protein [Candidatus Azotimanducaceae bacterium]
MTILELKNASVAFGGVKAIEGVSFSMEHGEVLSIVGPNGAGKTTLFNLISKIYDLDSGSIIFDDIELKKTRPHEIAKLGIARTFQNTELFEHESVLNNLLIGCHVHTSTNLFHELFFLRKARDQELVFRENAESIIDLLDLQSYRNTKIVSLPFGIRKLVEIGRALCLKPKLVLLDEPSSGLNPEETEDLVFQIEDIKEELGISILMIEHDMNLVSKASDRVLALADGKVLTIGKSQEVQEHPQVIKAYLG